jgi:hypothetical protein
MYADIQENQPDEYYDVCCLFVVSVRGLVRWERWFREV